MLVTINRQEFEVMDDVLLIWTCIEPTIRQIRGKSFLVKSEVSGQLNTSQQALLMFQMLYGHSHNGILELFDHLSYLLSEIGVWSSLKKGIRYFGESEFVYLLDEMEEVYQILVENYGNIVSRWLDVKSLDINSILRGIIDRLDMDLAQMMPAEVKTVGAFIRHHSSKFLQIEG